MTYKNSMLYLLVLGAIVLGGMAMQSKKETAESDHESKNLDIEVKQVANDAKSVVDKTVINDVLPHIDFTSINPNVNSSVIDNTHMTADTSGDHTGLIPSPYEAEWAGGDRFQKHYYGGWNTNQKYTNCYLRPSEETNGCNLYATMPVDERVSQQAKMRNNEKRVIDGWASKNMYYYRKNFSNELEMEEKLRWWGNDEY